MKIKSRNSRIYIFIIANLLLSVIVPFKAFATDSAVILMYHRFGESKYPTTNITVKQFKAHLLELKINNYNVTPIPRIIAAVRNGKPLPPKTIGISIDDAYLSFYKIGAPLLLENKFPYTIFVATDPLDKGAPGYMSWKQLRELVKSGANIGSQTASHLHMPEASMHRNAFELKKSNIRFKKELGKIPKMIAYPYGEFSLEVEKVSRDSGFTVGFGQHSGVIYQYSNFMYLPRFTFNESYGDLKRLRLAIRALPLRIADLTPEDPYLRGQNNPPIFGFSLQRKLMNRISQLACYGSHKDKMRIEILGKTRVEVRGNKAFPPGRTRINCTFPEKDGRWRWVGMQFLVPKSLN